MLTNEVIQVLNNANAYHQFPLLYPWFPIDVRLSAYRQDWRWALVIETFIFHQARFGHECVTTLFYCFGNDLQNASAADYQELKVTGDGPDGPLFDPDDVMHQIVSSFATNMTIRGKVVPITTNPAAYVAAEIELNQPPRILGYELFRLLAPKHRRLFLATEAEIVQRLGEPMPLLLRLDEWQHPGPNAPETPADSESFQMIAEAIAKNDPSFYQPTEPPNTHWSNWPMAGTM